MAKRLSQRKAIERLNADLRLENANLAKKASLVENRLENSMTDLMNGLTGGNGQVTNITSMNPMLQNNMYSPITLMWQTLLFAYRTHGLLQVVIDQPVLDALRGGLELTSDQLDHDDIRKVEDYLEENAVMDRIVDTFIWARLFGGGALIINTDDAESDEPLGDIGQGTKIEFYDACRWELMAERRIPASGKYGFYGQTLDASRVLTVVGKRAPYLLRAQLSDWGMSELERVIEDFNVFLRGRNVIYDLLEEAKVDVYQFENFNVQLATRNGTALTQKRVQIANQIKNFNNALILDAKDKYEQKQISFSGLAEIMKETRIGISSSLRIPMSKLFGLGSTGFSSGQDDLENYNSMVESEVRGPMKHVLRQVLKLVVRNLFGDDLDIRFKFKSLRVLSAVDEENILASKQTRMMNLYDRMLINSEEAGEWAQKEELAPIPLQAAEGLLDEHPVAAPNQAGVQPPVEGEAGGVIPEATAKAEKAEPAEKAEKANSGGEADLAWTKKTKRLK